MLHTDADLPVAVKSPIEAHDVRGVAFMQHLQLSDNLIPDGRFDFQVDQLERERRKPFNSFVTNADETDAVTSFKVTRRGAVIWCFDVFPPILNK